MVLALGSCSVRFPLAQASPTPTPAASPVAGGTLAWSDCRDGVECASLDVKLDRSNPAAGTITLDLARLAARPGGNRIGTLLVNPGGPGESGIRFLRGAARLLDPFRERFDVLSWDPRGVGGSDILQCEPGPDLERYLGTDPVVDDPAERGAWIDVNRAYAAGCGSNGKRILPFLGARDVAEDMDDIRAAVGDDKLSYLGISYGTMLGLTYADAHPERIRAMALDGAIDPALGALDLVKQQGLGFEAELNDFLAFCAGDTTCAIHYGGNPRAVLDRVIAEADRNGIPAGGRRVTAGIIYYSLAVGLYSRGSWPGLAGAIARGANGDGGTLLSLADLYFHRHTDGSYDPLFDVYTAVTCIDRPTPTDITEFDRLADSLAGSAPHFGRAIAWQSLPCAYWPVPPTGAAGPVSAPGSPPILVIGGTGDPATPYEMSVSVAKQLAHGVLLTRNGGGHPSIDKSQCVRDAVQGYLFSLTTPPDKTTCD
ncbi:MAG: hypothetical protein QOE92_143 [Chloroflexota bacterium]|nr:hypothetical protein [Chloroflexota bacterium]